ncbi:hypothetical protein GH714_030064 [Hevea brasiliensis]|uniref:Uncharacterized protein n=1 Tax=Hevea brasiliensis TaxID=3981 RepID=A0A6A6LKD2_HEVBR|nr:hypothetical protein GH714_030064 [Hevea brasiliensis]
MIPGGQMVLAMIGSDRKSDSCTYHGCAIWELLGITLNDTVLEGLIEETKLDWFNLPYYAPAVEEARHVIHEEGSFTIEHLEIFEVGWDANIGKGNESDKNERGKYVAMSIIVVVEFILASHFGAKIIDGLFERFARKIEDYLQVEKGEYTSMVISTSKD